MNKRILLTAEVAPANKSLFKERYFPEPFSENWHNLYLIEYENYSMKAQRSIVLQKKR